jgi:hypothetical protein
LAFCKQKRPLLEGRSCFKNERNENLAALFAVAAVRYQEPERRYAYQEVDAILKLGHGAYQHVNDVPVAACTAHKGVKADKAPIDASYGNQDNCGNVKQFHSEVRK